MTTLLAYIAVVIIWSTTPLAIQWSSQSGFELGLFARMVLGLVTLLFTVMFLGKRFRTDKKASLTYIASGLGIYFSMYCVYWGSQLIPSGWVSIIFGLSPVLTGIVAIPILKQHSLDKRSLLAIGISFGGLAIIFVDGISVNTNTALGMLAILTGTFTHATSSVIIKRIDAGMNGIQIAFGGLFIAVPLFALHYLFASHEAEASITPTTLYAIIYLGVFATAFGFSLYYFILKKLEVIQVSLITLITPVTALMLGHYLNAEAITASVIVGACLVMTGLASFQWQQNVVNK